MYGLCYDSAGTGYNCNQPGGGGNDVLYRLGATNMWGVYALDPIATNTVGTQVLGALGLACDWSRDDGIYFFGTTNQGGGNTPIFGRLDATNGAYTQIAEMPSLTLNDGMPVRVSAGDIQPAPGSLPPINFGTGGGSTGGSSAGGATGAETTGGATTGLGTSGGATAASGATAGGATAAGRVPPRRAGERMRS